MIIKIPCPKCSDSSDCDYCSGYGYVYHCDSCKDDIPSINYCPKCSIPFFLYVGSPPPISDEDIKELNIIDDYMFQSEL